MASGETRFPASELAYPPLVNPIVVIGPQFIVPHPMDLTISEKILKIGEGNFGVTDVKGNLLFKVRNNVISIRDRRTLLDSAGHPLVSLKQKILTAHKRWEVFRGDSNDPGDLIFSTKKSSMLQVRTELDVFLASNTSNVPDFKVKASWIERSGTIYAGDIVIGQMHKEHTMQSIVFDADSFAVTVYPNVDYAFIIALVVILDEISDDHRGDD
ncbi:hypothetical protein SLE2022_342390 [Rubroshorea leprosula]